MNIPCKVQFFDHLRLRSLAWGMKPVKAYFHLVWSPCKLWPPHCLVSESQKFRGTRTPRLGLGRVGGLLKQVTALYAEVGQSTRNGIGVCGVPKI